MTNEKREICRSITEFLTPEVAIMGDEKYENVKFSFRNLTTVIRDDRIRAEKKKSIKQIAKKEKLSCKQVYKIRSRK